MRRPCLVDGCPNLTTRGPRCALHAIGAYPYTERQRMRAAVDAHINQVGYWCPGYGTPPHPATDLTADHVTPRARGGIGGRLTVLCRSCNGRKQAR